MLQKVIENDNYMKLSRMGSRYPSRLSFSRSMLRRLINDNWKIHKSKFDLDKDGYGTVVYEIIINKHTYSLVCFSAFLDDKDRSDRVIANKWDTAYTLHVGKLSNEDLNMPLGSNEKYKKMYQKIIHGTATLKEAKFVQQLTFIKRKKNILY